MNARNAEWTGMNWIRQEKRLAIYLRDGLSCVYCGATIEDGALTLDHVRPIAKGGTNVASNLVTSCKHCNSARGKQSIARFASPEVARRIRRQTRRALPMAQAKELIAVRGSANKALRFAA